MRRRYVLGEPCFRTAPFDFHHAPAGQQAALCAVVLGETDNPVVIEQQLAREYTAVAYCLVRMGVRPDLIYSHRQYFEWGTAGPLMQEFGLKTLNLPSEISASYTCFPRDLCLRMGKLTLLNPHCRKQWRDNVSPTDHLSRGIVVSPLGEGGTTLVAGLTVVTQRHVIVHRPEKSIELNEKAFAVIQLAGMNRMLMPPSREINVDANYVGKRARLNKHGDRIYALLTGADGKPHLVIDSTVTMAGVLAKSPDRLVAIEPAAWLPLVRERCTEDGILMHEVPRMQVPFALNLLQFEDSRRVIMTGGDSEVQTLIEEIAGKGRVFTTDIPIRYFPTHRRGGIRCLIGDRPSDATFKLGLL